MAGPDLTAADIVAYPGLKLLLRASRRPEAAPLALGFDDFETRFPGIAAWMQRVEQRLAKVVGPETKESFAVIKKDRGALHSIKR